MLVAVYVLGFDAAAEKQNCDNMLVVMCHMH
jgi:hypothetical protein